MWNDFIISKVISDMHTIHIAQMDLVYMGNIQNFLLLKRKILLSNACTIYQGTVASAVAVDPAAFSYEA